MRGALLPGLLALALALASPLAAGQVVLTNGDRITGRVTSRGTRRVRVQTPYGTLVIPRAKVERILKDDGTEEVVTPPPTPAPTPVPPLRLELEVSGSSFWQAWDPKAAPSDASLRLHVQLDGRSIGAYRDPVLDPGDLPKATVNTFVFAPESVARESAPGVMLQPPEVEEGGIRLAIELPPAQAGSRELRLAYQANEGPFDEPRWVDLAEGALAVDLRPGEKLRVGLRQDRGAMEFVKKRMQAVETFTLSARVLDTPPPAP